MIFNYHPKESYYLPQYTDKFIGSYPGSADRDIDCTFKRTPILTSTGIKFEFVSGKIRPWKDNNISIFE